MDRKSVSRASLVVAWLVDWCLWGAVAWRWVVCLLWNIVVILGVVGRRRGLVFRVRRRLVVAWRGLVVARGGLVVARGLVLSLWLVSRSCLGLVAVHDRLFVVSVVVSLVGLVWVRGES